jgi:hypothetical protein
MIALLDQLEIYIVEDMKYEEFSDAGLSENDDAMVSAGAEVRRQDWQTMLNLFITARRSLEVIIVQLAFIPFSH